MRADAAWFRQYFYTGGHDGYFAANVYWASVTKYRITEWWKSSAFNQSFEGNAWFRVKRTCWTGAACDGSNVPYNGACYGCGTIGQACCADWGPIPTSGGWQGVCQQG